jgi:ABC-type nitrate/sulfonate/bicarbonate transport system substrate-binding protein/outer membrane protein OmpA-like peptidoglycan-associated protein
MFRLIYALSALLALVAFSAAFGGEELFQNTVGRDAVGKVADEGTIQVPYITWGGDMVTFYANGGLTTRPASLFARQGLDLKLVQGDDFVQQVRDYVSGKSPLLRGTFSMVGLAAETIGADPRTQGVVILQLTWSAGDHMVAREAIKTVRDLKGKTIALQKGGPHIGMLNDVLKTAQLDWQDIRVVWAADLTGSENSPAELLRKRTDIDACFVITPDMIGLCGGLKNTGSGAEGTIKGTHVLVSTAQMSHSIADVYVCRRDFYDSHKDWVTKFVAAYLKGCEEVVNLKKRYDGKGPTEYMNVLKMAQDIYGKKTLPSLEEDAHGLLSDCTFAGYPGNVSFFTDVANLHGFDMLQKDALDLAVNRGYARVRTHLLPSGLDYKAAAFTSLLANTNVARQDHFRAEAVQKEIEDLGSGTNLDSRTIVSFTINFDPNQTTFSVEQYAKEYQRVVQLADKYGNAVIAVRGHSDPTKTLLELVKAGLNKKILHRSGSNGSYTYSYAGKPLSLDSTSAIIGLIESGAFDGDAEHNPRENLQAALNLSRKRAEAVRDSIIAYAQQAGLHLDRSQIQPQGVGIREPFIAKPANMEEAKQNMRVEFRLLRIDAEAATPSDFDL